MAHNGKRINTPRVPHSEVARQIMLLGVHVQTAVLMFERRQLVKPLQIVHYGVLASQPNNIKRSTIVTFFWRNGCWEVRSSEPLSAEKTEELYVRHRKTIRPFAQDRPYRLPSGATCDWWQCGDPDSSGHFSDSLSNSLESLNHLLNVLKEHFDLQNIVVGPPVRWLVERGLLEEDIFGHAQESVPDI